MLKLRLSEKKTDKMYYVGKFLLNLPHTSYV